MSTERPKTIFQLWFVKRDDKYEEHPFWIGLYWAAADCEAAIARLRDKPGFRDYPEGFGYYEVTIGRDSWTEGFISVEEAMKPLDQDDNSD